LIDRKVKSARVRVGGLVIEDGRLLLIAHRKGKRVYWLLPGGGVDFGESLEEALERELKEELGIAVSVKDIAFVSDSIDPGSKRHIINICFHCRCKKGGFSLGTEKRLHDFGFFTPHQLRSLVLYPPVKKELGRLLAGSRRARIYLGKQWMNP
jgi:ADP-ribose pyrophosphatase YjhB (NUDIX family)